MSRNSKILILILILVAIIAVASAMMMNQESIDPESNQTLMVFDNNDAQHWVRSIAVIDNIPNAKGESIPMFIESWKQPQGRSLINLSEKLGHGDDPVPAGTTFRMRICSLPHRSNAAGNAGLNLTINGGDLINIDNEETAFDIIGTAPLQELPEDRTEGSVEIITDPAEGSAFLQTVVGQEFICIQLRITVNADGTVTIIPLTDPVLCVLMAGG